jgi:hypothetical protein
MQHSTKLLIGASVVASLITPIEREYAWSYDLPVMRSIVSGEGRNALCYFEFGNQLGAYSVNAPKKMITRCPTEIPRVGDVLHKRGFWEKPLLSVVYELLSPPSGVNNRPLQSFRAKSWTTKKAEAIPASNSYLGAKA